MPPEFGVKEISVYLESLGNELQNSSGIGILKQSSNDIQTETPAE